jgi:F-type H+-transporting ATPase subunit a
MIVEFINNFVKDIIGHHWKSFAPYIGTVLLFLVASNIIALFNIIPTSEQLHTWTGIAFFKHIPEIAPPTKDVNVTAAFSIMTIILVLGAAIRFKGVSGWAKGLLKPTPIMLPFNLLDYGTRFMSLSFRLFGNILAVYILVELLYGVIPPAVPLIGMAFDLFDGALQAYIFVFLTSIYIAEAVE